MYGVYSTWSKKWCFGIAEPTKGRVSELVQVLKYIVDKAGFVMVNRVALKDKESGKEYR